MENEFQNNFYKFIEAIKEGNLMNANLYYDNHYLNKSSEYGRTPIHIATMNGVTHIVQMLINRGCDIEAENTFKIRPIFIAASKGHADILKILIENKCNIEPIDDRGQRPIHVATWKGHLDIVQELINSNCFIEAEDKDKIRPIHLAAQEGHIDILKMLIDKNCNINPLTKDKKTPLDLAKDNNKNNCILLLKKSLENKDTLVPDKTKNFTFKIPDVKDSDFIGKGANGYVYKYFDKEIGRTFAVKKVLFINSRQVHDEICGLLNEIKIYSNFPTHPNIVSYFGSVKSVKSIYIFMHYMNGGSLSAYIRKKDRLNLTEIAKFCRPILEGLQFLHQEKIIHRDIKGENILLDLQNNVKLCDFGISKKLGTISCQNHNLETSENKVDIKLANTTCGTPYFMAPEVILGEDYSTWADVWSFGATVIEMLTGNHPYPNLNEQAAIFKIGNTKKLEYDSPSSMTEEFKLILEWMLAPDPMKRATVKELLESSLVFTPAEEEKDFADEPKNNDLVF